MATLLERYRNGECEGVWSDLERLGPAVRDEPYFDDARAVAEETMKRVRHNAELLVERLKTLGYQFISERGELFQNMTQMMSDSDRMIAALKKNAPGPDPKYPEFFAATQKIARENEPLLLQRQALRDKLMALEETSRQKPGKHGSGTPLVPPSSTVGDAIREYEESIGGPIPLSLRAWCEIVGSISLIGTHPTLCFRAERPKPTLFISTHLPNAEKKAAALRAEGVNATTTYERPPRPRTLLADPLVVCCTFEEEAGEDTEDDFPHFLTLSGDRQSKAGIYSIECYCMEMPNPSADAPFGDWHKTTFVNYLRIAFRWGGFPGWERYPERPEKELAYLRDGLLAF